MSFEEEWQSDGGQMSGGEKFMGVDAGRTPGELKPKNARKSIFIELYDNSLRSESERGGKGFILAVHR